MTRSFLGSTALCLLLILAPLPSAYAANITVDGDCSLANAIRSANGEAQTGAMNSCEAGDSGADTISLGRDVSLTEALPNITSTVTLEGNNRTLRRADTTGDLRLLVVETAGIVTINNLTLRDALLSGVTLADYGAALTFFGGGQLVVNNSIFRDNYAGRSSGALHSFDGTVTINDSVFINNSAQFGTATDTYGGAIEIRSNTNLTINNSVFRGNRALQGGAIHVQQGGTLVVSGSQFIGNHASFAGGAISTLGSTTIRNSIFSGNSALDFAGGLAGMTGPIEVENSTFFGNRLTGANATGAAITANDATLTLRHVTLLNNHTQQASLVVWLNSTLDMVNSVIAGSAGVDCAISSDSSIGTNINNWIEDGSCSPTFSGDPMMSTPRGSPAYVPPYIGSGLVDAAPADANCLATDQRGVNRPVGDACDIGAYEGAIPRPPPRTAKKRTPTPAVSTCLSLSASIRVTGISHSTQCQRLNRAGIGMPSLRDSFIDAVDVWSWVLPGTEVCFGADSGRILFIDTTVLPRAVAELPAYRAEGMTCTTIDRAGQVVLMPGPSALMQAARNRSLNNCMVTTDAILMFRDGPAGALLNYTDPRGDRIAGWLPQNVTLTALARTDAWFRVDYHGVQGWISADYVTMTGSCG